MTIFSRSGHWRTSKYGIVHWVGPHLVDRDEWDRYGYGTLDLSMRYQRLTELAANDSFTAQFVAPNATCPVCGNPVFFYQNTLGSRVYFDELGPPWPKHPCIDTGLTLPVSRKASPPEEIIPEDRTDDETREIICLNVLTSTDHGYVFQQQYGTLPPQFLKVEKRLKGPTGVFLIARKRYEDGADLIYLFRRRLPGHITQDSTLIYKKNRINLLALETMIPIELEVERIPSAKQFLMRLIQTSLPELREHPEDD